MLIIVATPIGNLGDISERARSVLASSDCIVCEDTRRTGFLLQALHLSSPCLVSLHRFNEASRENYIISLLHEKKNVALVSDAGTPGINDPGMALIQRCHHEHIIVTIVPGPCAFAAAFALSGSTCEKMQFIGFLPKTREALVSTLTNLYHYDGASVAYESPNRAKQTIEYAMAIDPMWEIVFMRELTKIHEEIVRLPLHLLGERVHDRTIKGECTFVFLPCLSRGQPSDDQLVTEVMAVREQFSCSLKEAIDIVAKQHRIPQRMLYTLCCNFSNSRFGSKVP